MQADSQKSPRIAWASNTQFTLSTKAGGELTTQKDCAINEHLQNLEEWTFAELNADERKELEQDKTALMYQPTDLSFDHMRSKTFTRKIDEFDNLDYISNVPYYGESAHFDHDNLAYHLAIGSLHHAFNTFASGQWLKEGGEGVITPKTEEQLPGSAELEELTMSATTDALILVPLDEERNVISKATNGHFLAKLTNMTDPESEGSAGFTVAESSQLNWIGFHDEDGVYDRGKELLSSHTLFPKYEHGLDTVEIAGRKKNIKYQFRDSFVDQGEYRGVKENTMVRSIEAGGKTPSRFLVWNYLLEAWSLMSLTNKWNKIFVIYSTDGEITDWPSLEFQKSCGLQGPSSDGYEFGIGAFIFGDSSWKLNIRGGGEANQTEGFAYAILDKEQAWYKFDGNETHPASIAFWASWAAMKGYKAGWATSEWKTPDGSMVLDIVDDSKFGHVKETGPFARASGIQCHLAPLSEPLLNEIAGYDLPDEEKPNFYRALGGWLVSESVYKSGTINPKWIDHHNAGEVGSPMPKLKHTLGPGIPSDTSFCELGSDDETFYGWAKQALALQGIWKPLYYSEELGKGGEERGGRIAYYPTIPIITDTQLAEIKKQTDLEDPDPP
jgi:hypothetical protein